MDKRGTMRTVSVVMRDSFLASRLGILLFRSAFMVELLVLSFPYAVSNCIRQIGSLSVDEVLSCGLFLPGAMRRKAPFQERSVFWQTACMMAQR